MKRTSQHSKKPAVRPSPKIPESNRVNRIAHAHNLIDLVEDLPDYNSKCPPVSDVEFSAFLASEMEKVHEIKVFLIGDRISNPVVDSTVFSLLIPFSQKHKHNQFFKQRILPKDSKLMRDPTVFQHAQKRLFKLSLGSSSIPKKAMKPAPPILVNGQRRTTTSNRVHFLPEKGDIVPKGAFVIDFKAEMKKSKKKIKEKEPERINFEDALIREMRMQYLEEKKAYRKSKRQKKTSKPT